MPLTLKWKVLYSSINTYNPLNLNVPELFYKKVTVKSTLNFYTEICVDLLKPVTLKFVSLIYNITLSGYLSVLGKLTLKLIKDLLCSLT